VFSGVDILALSGATFEEEAYDAVSSSAWNRNSMQDFYRNPEKAMHRGEGLK